MTRGRAITKVLRFTWSKNTKQWKTELALRGRGDRARLWTLNLPQLRADNGQTICPFAGDCAKVCYASQGWYVKPSVRASQERNLAWVRKADKDPEQLAAYLLDDLERLDPSHVRAHDSGDFFSPWYVQAWLLIAHELPRIRFYAYTKSIPLIPWGQLPRNFRIVQSLGGTRDDLVDRRRPHSAIFPSVAARVAAGYADGNRDDTPAIDGVRKIGLVYHGRRSEPAGVYNGLLRVVRG